ncbi:Dam family site-specific DNA-(adenine-N6)-methyltransferase [Spiroplasma diminutum]|uniref:site-specific DNA-methyltransferase (adenine-specific) n=1 Tax=Spiroplasma diminutum CUAS-1 TaxID=1276221 RepID=S5M2E5_9MOLU|nr:Dam family site-specific DNA-(adenine-N6)-methyltransferase [Spiroplasma diminutum]AGR42247.1 adenine specific DNA methyltransferase [Spiroplasma diminutum CUAS-1]
MKNSFIKSPINYLGNKNRLLEKIYLQLPFKVNNFIDVFSGSGTVSINSSANKIFLNDIDRNMILFLKIFYENTPDFINNKIIEIITNYKLVSDKSNLNKIDLVNYNRNFYLNLREDFNKDKDIFKLFVLILYSFNNQIRFNKNGDYNIPVGKSIYNKNVENKIFKYCELIKKKKCEFYNLHFSNFIEKILLMQLNTEDTIFYFDPPYLITTATYNKIWNENEELKLLSYLDMLNKREYKFMLSNVIISNGKRNNILKNWIEKNKYKVIEVNVKYDNSNYQRKNKGNTLEVIIKNF